MPHGISRDMIENPEGIGRPVGFHNEYHIIEPYIIYVEGYFRSDGTFVRPHYRY